MQRTLSWKILPTSLLKDDPPPTVNKSPTNKHVLALSVAVPYMPTTCYNQFILTFSYTHVGPTRPYVSCWEVTEEEEE